MGEPTGGGGEVGGGREEHFPRMEVINSKGDGAWVDAANVFKAAFSARSCAWYAAELHSRRGALKSRGSEV